MKHIAPRTAPPPAIFHRKTALEMQKAAHRHRMAHSRPRWLALLLAKPMAREIMLAAGLSDAVTHLHITHHPLITWIEYGLSKGIPAAEIFLIIREKISIASAAMRDAGIYLHHLSAFSTPVLDALTNAALTRSITINATEQESSHD